MELKDKLYVSPMKAIRLKCLDCCCGSHDLVTTCPVIECSLWKFRTGKNPNTEKNRSNMLLRKDLFDRMTSWSHEKTLNEIRSWKK